MIQKIIIACVATLIMQSCSRNVYVPSVSNVPLLSEKDDINIGFALNFIQLSYAPTNNIGLMLNADKQSFWQDPLQDSSTRRYHVEVGGGYYRHLNEYTIIQAYGGAGFGKVSFGEFNNIDSTSFSARQVKFFIMPSITFRHKYIDISLSTKFIGIDYYNINDSQYSYNSAVDNDFDLRLIDSPFYTLFEPAVTLRTGSEKIKMMLQVQHSFLLEDRPLGRRKETFVLGIHINLNTKK